VAIEMAAELWLLSDLHKFVGYWLPSCTSLEIVIATHLIAKRAQGRLSTHYNHRYPPE